MKSFTIGICFFLFTFTGSAAAQSVTLEGTWELVSTKWTAPDGTTGGRTIADSDDKGKSLKVLNATHFVVITHAKDGTFSHASGGPYTIDGNTYSEKLTTSSNPDLVGWNNVIEFKIENDICTSTWVGGNGTKVVEIWRRVRTE